MKICTSLEQSKKLIELGIDRKSSDMYYWCGSDLRIGGYRAQDKELDIPAWSLTSLIESITKVLQGGIFYNLTYDFILGKWTMNIEADNWKEDVGLYDNPVDAAFEMVCWLKENDKI